MPHAFFTSVRAELKRARHILVVSHIHPDPDAIGSALALGRIVRKLGKRVTIFIPGFSPARYEGLPGIGAIHRRLPRSASYDLIVGLDYGKFSRLSISSLLEAAHPPRLITIDHHQKQDQRGDVKWIDPKKSSVAEMVYDLANALSCPIDRRTAHYLLFGIVGDTVSFSTPSTTPAVLKKVIDLMERGGSLSAVQALIREWPSAALMKLAATALLRARVVPQKRFAYTWVREEEWKRRGVEPDALSFLANDLRMIRGIAVSLFLVEKEGKWEGHLRSRGEYKKNLGAIAARFGGGGHVHAAGFSTTLPLRTILTRILSLL